MFVDTELNSVNVILIATGDETYTKNNIYLLIVLSWSLVSWCQAIISENLHDVHPEVWHYVNQDMQDTTAPIIYSTWCINSVWKYKEYPAKYDAASAMEFLENDTWNITPVLPVRPRSSLWYDSKSNICSQ